MAASEHAPNDLRQPRHPHDPNHPRHRPDVGRQRRGDRRAARRPGRDDEGLRHRGGDCGGGREGAGGRHHRPGRRARRRARVRKIRRREDRGQAWRGRGDDRRRRRQPAQGPGDDRGRRQRAVGRRAGPGADVRRREVAALSRPPHPGRALGQGDLRLHRTDRAILGRGRPRQHRAHPDLARAAAQDARLRVRPADRYRRGHSRRQAGRQPGRAAAAQRRAQPARAPDRLRPAT